MRVLKSKVFHASLALLAAFVPLAIAVKPTDLYLLIGSVAFTTSIAVVHAYFPALRATVSRSIGDLDRGDILTMAILLAFVSIFLREAYVTFYRGMMPLPIGRPEDYFLPLAFFRYIAVVAALMAVATQPGNLGPLYLYKIPGWPRAVISLLSGIVLGFVLVWVHPS